MKNKISKKLAMENAELGSQIDQLLSQNAKLKRVTDTSSKKYDELVKDYQIAE